MNILKKSFCSFIILIFIIIGLNYRTKITRFLISDVFYKEKFEIKSQNKYSKSENYLYVSITDNFKPSNKQELLNVLYTIIDKGWEDFSFFCDDNYDCIEDISDIINDDYLLSNINNLIHPFNCYKEIHFNANKVGQIEVTTKKIYSEQEISEINQIVDSIYNEITDDSMDDREKIKIIHDYIINNTSYINELDEDPNSDYPLKSNTAYGTLINHQANCEGYTDTMALFLEKMGIKNYEISSETHVWNLVYLDGKWLNLDLTWDDPITNTGSAMLTHDFFLISTEELLSKDTLEHNFDQNVFLEATI